MRPAKAGLFSFWKPPRLLLPSERVSLAVVGDDQPGKRRVYLYLLAETVDVCSEIMDAGVARRHRLQEFLVTDDLSCIAN